MKSKIFILIIIVIVASIAAYLIIPKEKSSGVPNMIFEIPNDSAEESDSDSEYNSNNNLDANPDGGSNNNSNNDTISEGSITERGTITCIPKLGTGPQTMECAIGLKNTNGIYFGLKYLEDHDQNFNLVSPDITVEVTGKLIKEEIFGPDGNKYDTVGTIEIEKISEI